MASQVLLVDGFGLILAAAGFTLAFRQRDVRRGIDRLRARRGLPPLAAPAGGEDPLHYALIISGTMLMAFGIIVTGFATMYALTK